MNSVKLFLVEDQILTRQAFARAFSANDKYEVVGQSDGSGEITNDPATWRADVIILDMVLSHHACLQAITKLREHGVRSPILMLTNGENAAVLQAAIKAGAQGCLPKYSDFGEMEQAIERVAKGETYLGPSFRGEQGKNADNARQTQANEQTSTNLLSKREHEIFMYLAQGRKNKEIGKLLCISTRTVDTHRSNILKKLQVKSNAELARMAMVEGLLGW